MRLKVTSDGTPRGTNVTNADTGEELKGVVSVRWAIHRDGRCRMRVDLEQQEADVVSEPEKPEFVEAVSE